MRILETVVFVLVLQIAHCWAPTTPKSECRRRAIPIDGTDWPERFPAKEHCSRCGLCETSFVEQVTAVCAFLPNLGMKRLDVLEAPVHGRARLDAADSMERHFGVLLDPVQLARGVSMPGSQWTGVVTSIAVSMLESGAVDAVVCIASNETWSNPEPIVARSVDEVLRGRGVKPALAPSLKILDEIKSDRSIKKLLFCGVGCSVQAFRVIQDGLGLDNVYVLGTNCVDNSPTPEAAQDFVRKGLGVDNVIGYEFMQDYQVHVKTKANYITKPYFCLPGTIAEPSIAKSCLTCFDYTNGLADVVVGYMGAPRSNNMEVADQTLSIRNERGKRMVETAVQQGRLNIRGDASGSGSHQNFAVSTVVSDAIVQSMVGGTVQKEGAPLWIGKVLAFVLTFLGPKGLNFAKYSIDYHFLRNYLYILSQNGSIDQLPEFAQAIVEDYRSNKAIQELESMVVDRKKVV